MKLLSTINDIITNTYKVPVSGTPIILKEKRPTRCSEVKLALNGKMVILRFDQEESDHPIFPYFVPTMGNNLNKLCDYLIFYCPNTKEELFVFLCELKSGGKDKAFDQLIAGYLFAEFLVKTAFRCLKDSTPPVQYRGLVFSPKGTKGFTNPRKRSDYNKLSGMNLGYLSLPCKETCHLSTLCF